MKRNNDILTTEQKLEEIKYECYRNGFNYDKAIEAAEKMNGEDKENYVNILSDYIYDKIIENIHDEVTRWN